MDITYIISQVFVIVAMLFLGISYLQRDKKTIMILCIVYSVLYGGQYLLLGALTGFAMNIVSIIRNIWFYINAKSNRKNNKLVLMLLITIAIIFAVVSYDNIFSVIPALATILFTYSVWQNNTKVYRWLSLPISALWLSYNIVYKSAFGIIAELVLLTFEITGIIKNK